VLPCIGIGLLSGWSLWELELSPYVLLGLAIASMGLGNLLSQFRLNYAVVLGGTCLLVSALLYADAVSRVWVYGLWWVWAWGCTGLALSSPHKHKENLPKGAIGIGGQAIASYGVCASGLFYLSIWLSGFSGDFAQKLRLLLAISLFVGGIVSYSGWHCQRLGNHLRLHLEGIWGMQADYVIDLTRFSRIDQVKIVDIKDIHWLQLGGYNLEITLPLTVTGNANLEKTLQETAGLAKGARSQDSLALVHILLPQGASILAGVVLSLLGIALLWSLPIALSDQYALPLLWSIGLVSPTLGHAVLHLVAPNYLYPTPRQRFGLYSWELGLLLWLGLLRLVYPQEVEPLLGMSFGGYTLGIGICVLALVRRTPILTPT